MQKILIIKMLPTIKQIDKEIKILEERIFRLERKKLENIKDKLIERDMEGFKL